MSRSAASLALLTILLAACSIAGPSPSPAPTPTPSPSPPPSASPAAGFYLRAWYTQALPPRNTFSWLAMLTIADGVLLDGNVAIDMIFPGPLTISPIARPISPNGIAMLVDEARRLGLLGDATDFTGGQPMPGGRLAQLQLIVDGKTYMLTGDPDALTRWGGTRCVPDPGTPEAFAAFWQERSMAGTWLAAELGTVQQFVP